MRNRTTYKVLTWLGLILPLPLNRIYLGRSWGWRLITFNWFWVGGIFDLFYMDRTFDETMFQRGFVNTEIRNKLGK